MPAGYSETPLARKLGIKAGQRLAVLGSPPGWTVDALPAGVRPSRFRAGRPADIILAFFSNLRSLQRQVPSLAQSIIPDGSVWLAWPRRAGGHRSDITENDIRAAVLPLGLVDVKVAAIDDDWSGLKVVWRKELRGQPNMLATTTKTGESTSAKPMNLQAPGKGAL